ncbi:MAG: NifU family protein [Rhodospirillaceae bacterium]|nr:NifU family protein [Rhodospirillaceae bacterium]
MTVFAATVPGIGDIGKITMTEAERLDLIERTLDELRPRIIRDGGNITLVAVRGKDVYVKMSGACVGCQLASLTLNGVQQRLMTALKQIVRVRPAELLKNDA